MVLPSRVRHDVGHDHRFAPDDRRAERPCFGTDRDAVDCIRAGVGQVRRSAASQMKSFLVEQEDRGRQPGKLRFDGARDPVEHGLQRHAGRDHFEDRRLFITCRVRAYAFGNVAGHADDAEYLVGGVAQRDFCRRDAGLSVQRTGGEFLLVDHRLPGLDDPSFVSEIFLGEVRRAKFEVCFPDQIFRVDRTPFGVRSPCWR